MQSAHKDHKLIPMGEMSVVQSPDQLVRVDNQENKYIMVRFFPGLVEVYPPRSKSIEAVFNRLEMSMSPDTAYLFFGG